LGSHAFGQDFSIFFTDSSDIYFSHAIQCPKRVKHCLGLHIVGLVFDPMISAPGRARKYVLAFGQVDVNGM
jgi:hypothetical protein